MTETTETRSAEEIEREISEERGEIHRTVYELKARMSLGAAVESLVDAFRDRRGEAQRQIGTAGRNLGRSVRDNPLPLALIGAGVALMFAGGGPSGDTIRHRAEGMRDRIRSRRDDDRDDAWSARASRWDEDERDDDPYGDLYDEDLYGEDPYLVPNLRSPARYDPEPLEATPGTPGTDQRTGEHRTHSRTREDAEALREAARRRLGSARDSASGMAAGAREGASRVSSEVRDRAEHARRRAADTAHEARRRAAEARDALSRAGHRASRRLGSAGRMAGERAQHFVHDQPLAAGAIALAVGAALGSAIANTRAENRLMGDAAERVRDGAADALVGEARKARRVAEAAAEEAVRLAEEAAGEAAPGSGDEAVRRAEAAAQDAAGRIGTRAQAAAERENLGRPDRG